MYLLIRGSASTDSLPGSDHESPSYSIQTVLTLPHTVGNAKNGAPTVSSGHSPGDTSYAASGQTITPRTIMARIARHTPKRHLRRQRTPPTRDVVRTDRHAIIPTTPNRRIQKRHEARRRHEPETRRLTRRRRHIDKSQP